MTYESIGCDFCGEQLPPDIHDKFTALEIILRGEKFLIIGTREIPIEVLLARQKDPKDPSNSSKMLDFCREECLIKRVLQFAYRN
jgi:hypothetical protein